MVKKKKSKKDDIINEFIERYAKEEDYYAEAANLCKVRIEELLSQAGIKAIVSSRAKKLDRLRDKVINRNAKEKYKTVKSIYRDIVDLAGVRVALYFPADRSKVADLIKASFDVKETKSFPLNKDKETTDYKKRFSGYWASHYRINLKSNFLKSEDQKYINANIEIQEASLLMHSWSEVEHDLVYKPKTGEVSNETLAILDEINGLVMVGEVALERLQSELNRKAEQDGSPFGNQYDLASYLNSYISQSYHTKKFTTGRLDTLFIFLKKSKLNTPKELKSYLKKLNSNQPIDKQVVDAIIQSKPELLSYWQAARKQKSELKNVKITKKDAKLETKFLKAFVKLEPKIITNKAVAFKNTHGGDAQRMVKGKFLIKAKNVVSDFNQIQKFRNQLVHGTELPPADKLQTSLNSIKSISAKIRSSKPKAKRLIKKGYR